MSSAANHIDFGVRWCDAQVTEHLCIIAQPESETLYQRPHQFWTVVRRCQAKNSAACRAFSIWSAGTKKGGQNDSITGAKGYPPGFYSFLRIVLRDTRIV